MATPRKDDQSATRKNLSKNLLQMKFMQRGKSDVESETKGTSSAVVKDDSHWVVPGFKQISQRKPFYFENSYVSCEDLLTIGHMSFLNFNPAVEKVHRDVCNRLRSKKSGEKEAFDGISDNEMAQRYETLVDTIAKKYESKRKASQLDASSDSEVEDRKIEPSTKKLKAKFMKPKLD